MLKDWISETRPRTLLLGLTNCAVGCGLGFYYGAFNLYNLFLAILIIITGVLLQILSNLANDYGDFCKNADGANRVGPIRAFMTGAITPSELKRAMALVIIMASVTGLTALFMSVSDNIETLALFVFLGVIAMTAAIFYTLGAAYGYKALGDVSVFLFFGLAAVIGPQILITSASGSGVEFYPDSVILGISVGFASVMVLHVANMRDIDEDRIVGKITVASKLGHKASAVWHLILFILVVSSSFVACFLSHKGWEISILAISLFPLMASVLRVLKYVSQSKYIAQELKFTLLGTAIHHVAWLIVLTVDFWVYL